MKLVIVESPYAGNIERNTAYARLALADCLMRGEAPFASHLLYTQPGVLNDVDPAERTLGIEAGLAWGRMAQLTVVYTDYGISAGMELGIKRAEDEGRQVVFRSLAVDCHMTRTRTSTEIVSDILHANHGRFVRKHVFVAALAEAGLTAAMLGGAICKIRNALPEDQSIQTLHGEGYCLTKDPRVCGIAIPARGRIRLPPPPPSSPFYKGARPRYGR